MGESVHERAARKAVIVSLDDLKKCQLLGIPVQLSRYLIPFSASIPFETLEDAFGPFSLGILIVRDLPPNFTQLRHKLLSYSSYLANLPSEQLGILRFQF